LGMTTSPFSCVDKQRMQFYTKKSDYSHAIVCYDSTPS
jgi:hypothetical protein